jgi:hypothetical protein
VSDRSGPVRGGIPAGGAPGPPPAPGPAPIAFAALWIVGALAVITPFWLAVVPPMTDVSQHVLVARILTRYGDTTARYAEYFAIVSTTSPAVLFYRVLGALQSAVGPYTDAKVYLSAFVVLLSVSAWVLARVRRVETPALASLLILPLGGCWYVYGGLLPFVMTFPLFALTVAAWWSRLRPTVKIPLLWVGLLLLYAFHIVGAAAAAIVIATDALVAAARTPRSLHPLLIGVVAGIPLAALAGAYLLGAHGPTVTVTYGGIGQNLVHTISYTSSALTRSGRALMLLWLAGLGVAALWQGARHRLPAGLPAPVLVLGALSVLLPTSLGALWPAGPRLLPYAVILLVAGLSCSRRALGRVALATVILVLALNVPNALQARALDRQYRQFLSGIPLVAPGSKLLPILVDPYAGAKSIWPFWSLASAYPIYRGGATPYVFAEPYVKTGASPLRYRHRDEFGYAFLYDPPRPARDYRGVGRQYDYVLVWGVDPDLYAVLAQELTLRHRDGPLRLYASTDRDHRRADTGR